MVEVQVIIEQVRSATVVIATGPPGRGQPKGSGFFIAPGRVLTCAHVVEEAGNDLFVWWFDKYAPAKVHQSTPSPAVGEARQGDAAVLYVESEDHACVPLAPGPAQVEDRVWVYGVSKVRGGRERPVEFDGALLDISAIPVAQGEVRAPYLTLLGRISPGMSGGPVLNLKPPRAGVCGLAQARATDGTTDVSYAVEVGDALELGDPEDLRADNPTLLTTLETIRSAQLGFRTLPTLVAAKVAPAAATLIHYYETTLERQQPDDLTLEDCNEWVARQLFTLSLSQLIGTLQQVISVLTRPVAYEVFQLVAPCLLVSTTEPWWWWIPPDAAETLFAEFNSKNPRLVHLRTDDSSTIEYALRRALAKKVNIYPCGSGFSGEPGPDAGAVEINAEVLAEIKAAIGEALAISPDENWTFDSEIAQELRDENVVVKIDLGPCPDLNFVKGIKESFTGVQFVIPRKEFEVPPGADDHLLELMPSFFAANERKAGRALTRFNTLLSEKLPWET